MLSDRNIFVFIVIAAGVYFRFGPVRNGIHFMKQMEYTLNWKTRKKK